MTDIQNHIIQRQVFELSTVSSKSNFEWERRASGYISNIINPGLEACFRDHSNKDEHLIIEKLEIDLGTFTSIEFEKEARNRLVEILGNRLKSHHEIARPGTKFREQNNYNKTGNIYSNNNDIKENNHTNVNDKEEAGTLNNIDNNAQEITRLIGSSAAFELALGHFLLHGRFPWWYKIENVHTTPGENFKMEWVALMNEAEKKALTEILGTSEASRIRLVNHFSAEWIAEFLQMIGLTSIEDALLQWKILSPVLKNYPRAAILFHQYFWIAWIEAAINDVPGINILTIVEKTSVRSNYSTIEIAQDILEVCAQNNRLILFADYAAKIRKYIGNNKQLEPFQKLEPREIPIKKGNDIALVKASLTENKNKTFRNGEPLFVPAIGMVILHPFLVELYQETGLWKGENWQSENSPFRAIQILSWLAYGETGLPEYRLLFFKVMTGIDIDEPIPAEPPLTDEETGACKDLLSAVIMHWRALRNTGIGGLQEGFLQRAGKLSKGEKDYLLIVERQAQDVLLSHLPWGYSMIKFPWMEQMIKVTWI